MCELLSLDTTTWSLQRLCSAFDKWNAAQQLNLPSSWPHDKTNVRISSLAKHSANSPAAQLHNKGTEKNVKTPLTHACPRKEKTWLKSAALYTNTNSDFMSGQNSSGQVIAVCCFLAHSLILACSHVVFLQTSFCYTGHHIICLHLIRCQNAPGLPVVWWKSCCRACGNLRWCPDFHARYIVYQTLFQMPANITTAIVST